MPDVLIVLSTFNSERFLAEQLESIERQTFRDWKLLARDDGSSDRTLAILDRFARRDPRFQRLMFDGDRLGPALNFGRLLEEAVRRDARYIFLCDHDDVWLSEKMERQLEQLRNTEQRFGAEIPLLLHSDLIVVDERLRVRHPSFLESQRLKHQARRPLESLAVQNFVTGCSVVVNQALLNVAAPISREAVMHDWWLALCAAATGRILFDPQPTVLYRQHETNAIGAKGYWANLWQAVIRRRHAEGWNRSGIPKELEAVLRQNEAAIERFADFHPPSAKFLAEFVDLWRKPSLPGRRLSAMRRLGTRRLDPLRQLLLQTRLYFANPGSTQR